MLIIFRSFACVSVIGLDKSNSKAKQSLTTAIVIVETYAI